MTFPKRIALEILPKNIRIKRNVEVINYYTSIKL